MVHNTDHIRFITEDASGNIWIGTLGNGLNRYDPKTRKTTHYINKKTTGGFTDISAWSFCHSRDGIFWVGTTEGSLYRINTYINIPHIATGSQVICFDDDPHNGLWIGTVKGLIFKNQITGITKKFVHDEDNQSSLSSNYVTSLFHDNSGVLWVGTYS